jgi:hypothetical protein
MRNIKFILSPSILQQIEHYWAHFEGIFLLKPGARIFWLPVYFTSSDLCTLAYLIQVIFLFMEIFWTQSSPNLFIVCQRQIQVLLVVLQKHHSVTSFSLQNYYVLQLASESIPCDYKSINLKYYIQLEVATTTSSILYPQALYLMLKENGGISGSLLSIFIFYYP